MQHTQQGVLKKGGNKGSPNGRSSTIKFYFYINYFFSLINLNCISNNSDVQNLPQGYPEKCLNNWALIELVPRMASENQITKRLYMKVV